MNNTVPADRWVHVAGTYDRNTATVQLYVDGTAVQTIEQFFPHRALGSETTANLQMGHGWGNDWSNNAALDDVRVYNGILDAAAIAVLAQ